MRMRQSKSMHNLNYSVPKVLSLAGHEGVVPCLVPAQQGLLAVAKKGGHDVSQLWGAVHGTVV